VKPARPLLALLASAIGVQGCATRAREHFAGIDPAGLYEVRVDPTRLSAAAFMDIAANADPMALEIPPGATLSQAIEQRCGIVPHRYVAEVRALSRSLDGGNEASLETPAPESRLIEAPFCFPAPQSETATGEVQRVGIVQSALRGAETFAPIAFHVRRFFAGGNAEAGAPPPTLLDASDPAQRVVLLASLSAATDAAEVASTGSAVGQQLQTLSDDILRQSDPECLLEHGETAFQYDDAEILNLLADNAAIRAANPALPTRRTRSIVILDSGIAGLSVRPFDAGTVHRVSAIYPMGSDQAYPDHQHGAYVASAALGGAELAYTNVHAAHIQLEVANLIDANRRLPNGAPGVLLASDIVGVLEKLQGADVAAVNLSVRFVEPINGLAGVTTNHHPLYVVAAGNDGQMLSGFDAYPAILGGVHRMAAPNILTVAALDLDGNVAQFSNRGADFVEIAAPGCAVELLRFDTQNRRFVHTFQSGTSFAAPLVSFAAALTSQESGLMGEALKERLLYGADLRPALASAIAYGRVLNPVKAASVFTDVIERENAHLARGRLDFVGQDTHVAFSCDAGVIQIARGNLRKISRWRENDRTLRLVFYRDASRGAMVARCHDDPISVTFLEWNAAQPSAPFDLNDLEDVVFAQLPYWRSAQN
jgi:hypothetical protein